MEKKGNLFDLFKTKNMVEIHCAFLLTDGRNIFAFQAIKTIVLYLNWFTNSLVYYGLTLNTGSFGGSFLLNFVVNGLLEIPAYVIGLFIILKASVKCEQGRDHKEGA